MENDLKNIDDKIYECIEIIYLPSIYFSFTLVTIFNSSLLFLLLFYVEHTLRLLPLQHDVCHYVLSNLVST